MIPDTKNSRYPNETFCSKTKNPFHNEEKCEGIKTCEKIQVPIISSSCCNNIPVYPKELEPKDNIYDFKKKNNQYRLVPKSDFRNKFKFNFKIPDLKFDGIYSRIKENGKCKWSLCDKNTPDFFGTNKLSPIPEKSLFDKIIIEPPECAGFESGYSPLTYYIPNNDCSE